MIFAEYDEKSAIEKGEKIRDIISQPLTVSQSINQRSLVLLTFQFNPQLISLLNAWHIIISEMQNISNKLKLLSNYCFSLSCITYNSIGYNPMVTVSQNDENPDVELENFFTNLYFEKCNLMNTTFIYNWIRPEMEKHQIQSSNNSYNVLRAHYPSVEPRNNYGYPMMNFVIFVNDKRTYDINGIYYGLEKLGLPPYITVMKNQMNGFNRESTVITKSVNDINIMTYILKDYLNKTVTTLTNANPISLYNVSDDITRMLTLLSCQFDELKQTCCECKKDYPISHYKDKRNGKPCKMCITCRDKSLNWRPKCKCAKDKKTPYFGMPGDKKAQYCRTCAPPGAVDILHRKCKGCPTDEKKSPSYNYEGQRPEYCNKCKLEGMINVKHSRCEKCTKGAVYGFLYEMKKRFCTEHAPQETINLRYMMCEVCEEVTASLGYPDEYPRWCQGCSPVGVVSLTHKLCEICNKTRPTYGLLCDMKVRWCEPCSPPNAINIADRNKLCIVCKEMIACFNYEGYNRGKYCSDCKPADAVNVMRKKCHCGIIANYNLAGHSPILCFQHRTEGMIVSPTRRCKIKSCTGLAIYGKDKREHCSQHKIEGDINFVERPCVNCGLEEVVDDKGFCGNCNPNDNRLEKKRENRVRDLFISQGIVFAYNRIYTGSNCSNYRPDFVFDPDTNKDMTKDHVVIVEVDEDQHKRHEQICERTRMFNVTQTFGGIPILWIRYNPDEFKHRDGNKSNLTQIEKEAHLLEWIRYALRRPPKKLLEVIYLNYDGCSDRMDESNVSSLDLQDFRT